jgi:hypothetical protein
MKKIFFLSLFLFSSFVGFNQIMSTHLLKYENSINPLFSKKSKQISITFDENNIIDSAFKFYVFKIDISDRKAELNGISNDINIGAALSGIQNYGIIGGLISTGLSSSKQFTIRNTNGFVVFDKNKFDSLYKVSKKLIEIMKLTKGLQNYAKTYFYQIDKLQISLEVDLADIDYNTEIRGNTYSVKKTVLFKIDESIFLFTEEEFIKLYSDVLVNVNFFLSN